jgi:hypothetical protein
MVECSHLHLTFATTSTFASAAAATPAAGGAPPTRMIRRLAKLKPTKRERHSTEIPDEWRALKKIK